MDFSEPLAACALSVALAVEVPVPYLLSGKGLVAVVYFLTHSFFHSLTLTHLFTHSLTLTHSLNRPLTLSLSLVRSLTLTHSLTHFFNQLSKIGCL